MITGKNVTYVMQTNLLNKRNCCGEMETIPVTVLLTNRFTFLATSVELIPKLKTAYLNFKIPNYQSSFLL